MRRNDRLAAEPSPRAFVDNRGQVSEIAVSPWGKVGLPGLHAARITVARYAQSKEDMLNLLSALGIQLGVEHG